MADEIVAKYRVDVSGASAALDQLAAKTQKTGQTLDDSFNKGSDGVKRLQAELAKQPKTLADLELRLVKLKELLRDDTKIGTEGFKQVTKAINDTNAAIAKTNSELEETPKKANVLVDGLKKVGAAMLAAFAADRIVAFAKEAVELAAKAEGVERAFKRVGSAQLLDGLRSATRGTVNDLTLMTTAVQASNFKIPLENLAKYMEFANARARETGKSVDYLVESILQGVGRGSIEVWDNMGISISDVRSRLNGVSIESLTVAERSKIMSDIVTEELAKMGTQATTTAERIDQMKTAFDNFKVAVGKEIILQFSDLNTEIAKTAEILGKSDIDGASVALKGLGLAVKLLLLPFEELNSLIQINARIFNYFKGLFGGDELETGSKQLTALQNGFAAIRKTIDENNKAKETDNATTKAQIENVFFYTEAIKNLNEKINEEGTAVADILPLIKQRTELEEKLKAVLGEETEALKAKRLAEEELLKIEKKRAEEYNKAQEAESERLRKQAEDTAKERVKIAEDMAEMLLDIERYLARESNDILDLDKADNQRFYEARIATASNTIAELGLTEAEGDALYLAAKAERNQADEDAEAAHNARIISLNKAKLDAIREQETSGAQLTEEQKQQIFEASAQTTVQLIGMVGNAIQEGYNQDLANLDRKLEQGLISEEQYQREKGRLMTKAANAAKAVAIFEAIINTAVAVTSASTAGPIIGPVLAALAAVLGAAQIAAIVASPVPQFAKGGWVDESTGLITGQKHTQGGVTIEAEGGEFITNSKQSAKHANLLGAINKGVAEKYILSNYVKPALDSAMLSGFTDMGKSAELNGLTANLKDSNIIAAMDRNRQATVHGLKLIAERMGNQRQPKRGGYE